MRPFQDKLLPYRLLSPLYLLDPCSLDLFVLPTPDVLFLLFIIALQMMSQLLSSRKEVASSISAHILLLK